MRILGLDKLVFLSYNTTLAEEEKPLRWEYASMLSKASTTWLDHAVLVLYDHIFRWAAFDLTTPCFVLPLFFLRLLPLT